MAYLTLRPIPCPPAPHGSFVPITSRFGVAWQPRPVEGEVLACATDKGAKIWDMEGGRIGLKDFGNKVNVKKVAWSPDGLLLITIGDDEAVVWKSDGNRLTTLQFHPRARKDRIESIKFNDSGRLFAVGETNRGAVFNHNVYVFDVLTGLCLKTVMATESLSDPFEWRNELEFYTSQSETITLHKVGQDSPVQILTSRNRRVLGLAFNQDSGVLALCGPERNRSPSGIELWHPPQYQPSFLHTDLWVKHLVWNPQNSTLLAGIRLYGGVVYIWDSVTRTSLVRISADNYNRYEDISFSPDGRFLAAFAMGMRAWRSSEVLSGVNVQVWKVSTGEKVAKCKMEYSEDAARASWSPNGEKVVKMNLKTLSMIRVAECLKQNGRDGREDVEELFKQQFNRVPEKLVKEMRAYLE